MQKLLVQRELLFSSTFFFEEGPDWFNSCELYLIIVRNVLNIIQWKLCLVMYLFNFQYNTNMYEVLGRSNL